MADFNTGLGVLTAVTIDVEVMIEVFVTGQSKSTPPTGGTVEANVNGEADATLAPDGTTLATSSPAQYIQTCTASREGVRCTLGDGSLIALNVGRVANASIDVQNACAWARTFGTETSIVRATITYEYAPGGAVADRDNIGVGIDNCTQLANTDQRDTNGEGTGNACDADLNGDCSVNFGDLAFMNARFFNGADPGPGPAAPGNDCE